MVLRIYKSHFTDVFPKEQHPHEYGGAGLWTRLNVVLLGHEERGRIMAAHSRIRALMEYQVTGVSKWIGHSITVSGKHYANRALDHHFDAASKRSSKAAQNAAQHVPAAPCTGLHRKNDDDRRGRGTAAGANTCNAMRVGASAPNNGAGGSRTPVP